LFECVPRGDGDPESFLPSCYGGVVDGLDIDVVFGKEFVRGGFG